MITDLNNEEQLLVNSEIEKRGKNLLLAYILAIFVGTLAIHRFYLGRKGSAIAMLLLGIFSFFIISSVWTLVDLFLIPGIVKEDNQRIETETANEIRVRRGNNPH